MLICTEVIQYRGGRGMWYKTQGHLATVDTDNPSQKNSTLRDDLEKYQRSHQGQAVLGKVNGHSHLLYATEVIYCGLKPRCSKVI